MLKMWWVIKYLDSYHDPKNSTISAWYSGEVKRNDFVWYLLFGKHYREDIRDTIQRWYASLQGKEIFMGEIGRARRQRKDIDDTIDMCQSRGFISKEVNDDLASNELVSDPKLSVVVEGRRFIKPLNFIEACANEYNKTISLFVFFLSGSGITLLIIFWNRIINYFVR